MNKRYRVPAPAAVVEGIGETHTLFTIGGLGVGAIMIIVGITRIRRGAILVANL